MSKLNEKVAQLSGGKAIAIQADAADTKAVKASKRSSRPSDELTGGGSLDRALRRQGPDLRLGIAQLLQDLLPMLAEQR